MCIRDSVGAIGILDGSVFEITDCSFIGNNYGIACQGAAPICLLYTSDAADERSSVDLGGRRIIKKKKQINTRGHLPRIQHKRTKQRKHNITQKHRKSRSRITQRY